MRFVRFLAVSLKGGRKKVKLKPLTKNKKGQLGNLHGIVLTLVIIGILIGAAFLILEKFRDEIEDIADDGDNASSYQGVNDTIEAMTTIPDLLGLIILIALVGIILAVVFSVIPTGRVGGA